MLSVFEKAEQRLAMMNNELIIYKIIMWYVISREGF